MLSVSATDGLAIEVLELTLPIPATLHGKRPQWKALIKNAATYVVQNTLPFDPHDKPGTRILDLIQPSSLSDARFSVFVRHILDGYEGKLPPERVLRFVGEQRPTAGVDLDGTPIPAFDDTAAPKPAVKKEAVCRM